MVNPDTPLDHDAARLWRLCLLAAICARGSQGVTARRLGYAMRLIPPTTMRECLWSLVTSGLITETPVIDHERPGGTDQLYRASDGVELNVGI